MFLQVYHGQADRLQQNIERLSGEDTTLDKPSAANPRSRSCPNKCASCPVAGSHSLTIPSACQVAESWSLGEYAKLPMHFLAGINLCNSKAQASSDRDRWRPQPLSVCCRVRCPSEFSRIERGDSNQLKDSSQYDCRHSRPGDDRHRSRGGDRCKFWPLQSREGVVSKRLRGFEG